MSAVRSAGNLGISRSRVYRARLASFIVTIAAAALFSPEARACAVCFGNPDDKMTQGMLAGVLVLLLVVLSVLGGFVALFVYMARRAAAAAEVENQSAEFKA